VAYLDLTFIQILDTLAGLFVDYSLIWRNSPYAVSGLYIDLTRTALVQRTPALHHTLTYRINDRRPAPFLLFLDRSLAYMGSSAG
jgi:hypothetical protein